MFLLLLLNLYSGASHYKHRFLHMANQWDLLIQLLDAFGNAKVLGKVVTDLPMQDH